MGAQPSPSGASIGPIGFAIGVAVVLVGLIVNPLVLAPLGAAITVAAAFAWAHSNRRAAGSQIVPPAPDFAPGLDERYSRSRLLEGATLALGGLVAVGVALPTAGFAVL